MSINNLFSIGNHALISNQVAINVTGNNIAGANIEGYSRQKAEFKNLDYYQSSAGQLGMGVEVSEITRSFDRLLENTFLTNFTQSGRYSEQSGILSSVENLFNESERDGINSSLSEFYNYWQEVANDPNDIATKQALLASAEKLTSIIRETQDTLGAYQKEIDAYIEADVKKVNQLTEAIAQLNKDIIKNTSPGNNPNAFLDERDRLVRELAEIVDVKVEDTDGEFSVRLATGQPLVEGETTYELDLMKNQVDYNTQGYDGEVEFSGSDAFEYTMEFTDENTFKVSIDGGKTWLKNEDGSIQTFEKPEEGKTVKVKDLEISFSEGTQPTQTGDKITITPKTGLYWVSPTNQPQNITPSVYPDGTDNKDRLSGGSLTAYFNTRDHNIGKYMDKIDALASTIVWEMNSIHSQGSSTTPRTDYYGTEKVKDPLTALGDSNSGLFFGDKLQEGNMTLYIYNEETGELEKSGPIDFDGDASNGITNFDPETQSLEDVKNAINSSFGGTVSADIVNGQLEVTSADGKTLRFGEDSTGLLAALGMNTLFTGSDASDISVRDELRTNPALINSGKVNEAGVLTEGDNSIALKLAKLATEPVTITTAWETTSQSISGYYSGIVSLVGAETSNANFNADYYGAMSGDLKNQIASKSGVSLDEEMTSLIKFQHSYTSAAKLITTADEMLQTVLGLKQ